MNSQIVASKDEWELWKWPEHRKKTVYSLRHTVIRFEVQFNKNLDVIAILKAPAGHEYFYKKLPQKIANLAQELLRK